MATNNALNNTLNDTTLVGGGASATEVRFLEPSGGGTSYVALKSPALAANVTLTLPATDGDASQVLTTDGSGVLSWATPSSGSVIRSLFTCNFGSSAREQRSVGGSGVNTQQTWGLESDTSVTGSSFAKSRFLLSALGSSDPNTNNPTFTCSLEIDTFSSTDGLEASATVGIPTYVAGSAIDFTIRHWGFHIKRVSGVKTLYATNADGTTQTETSMLTGLVANRLELRAVYTSGSKIDFYYSSDGGAWSSATTHTTNLPTTSTTADTIQVGVSNAANAAQFKIQWGGVSYYR